MTSRFPPPSYLSLLASGELEDRAAKAADLLRDCTVCPRKCRVDRTRDEKGFCRTGMCAQVSSMGPHFGEEPELVGRGGSGTIFIAHCNLACSFCQNYEISQCGDGEEADAEGLAAMMLSLQRRGCHNINIVTPSHVIPQILAALVVAAGDGLVIPLVYNTGGYDAVETLRLLDGVFDIYMPDAKYSDTVIANDLSRAPGYVEVMKAALKEMHRQVGVLKAPGGIAVRGLIIRHLVLPGGLAGTEAVMRFIGEEISPDSYVNVMAQYRWPASVSPPESITGNARYRGLLRPLNREEFRQAIRYAEEAGLHRGFRHG